MGQEIVFSGESSENRVGLRGCMKPCDVKTLDDYDKLEDAGLAFNSKKIEINTMGIGIDAIGVILTIDPYCRMKFNHSTFRRFAEWYLADQGDHKGDE